MSLWLVVKLVVFSFLTLPNKLKLTLTLRYLKWHWGPTDHFELLVSKDKGHIFLFNQILSINIDL